MALIIFDCDGVLIDSEPVSRKILSEEAASLGWALSEAAAQRFTGLTWTAIKPKYEEAIGFNLAADWPAALQKRLITRLACGVPAVEGAREVLEATGALGVPFRVASNSSHEEMFEKFSFTGLWPLVEGRLHSARDVARGKPAPDLFLAAAAAEGVSPEACLVVEDSRPGIHAAQAAGMRVVAFAPEGLPSDLDRAPDFIVRCLRELPALFASEAGL